MSRKKTGISEAERQRRARQAAEAATAKNDPQSAVDLAAKKLTTAGHPSTLVAKHQKSTGRGT